MFNARSRAELIDTGKKNMSRQSHVDADLTAIFLEVNDKGQLWRLCEVGMWIPNVGDLYSDQIYKISCEYEDQPLVIRRRVYHDGHTRIRIEEEEGNPQSCDLPLEFAVRNSSFLGFYGEDETDAYILSENCVGYEIEIVAKKVASGAKIFACFSGGK